MAHQTLPSLATAMRFAAGTERRGDPGPPTSGFLSGGQLSADATRELAKCANGEHVSHDVIRDGIDALLLMKRDSFDHSACQNGRDYREWRTSPEYPPIHPSLRAPVWNDVSYEAKREVDSSSDEEDEENGGYVFVAAEVHVVKDEVKPRKRPVIRRTSSIKKTLPLPPPPANRPPTIWHSRKSELLSPPTIPTPDSPKSKVSVEEESEHEPEPQEEQSEEEIEEGAGPAAILHFSCIQCHRAKKRCNRTRPCTRCTSRGMEHECRYPDKHDPRSVLRACLRCWQTKKKCDRKQPSCGKCDKVGVKCIYRREGALDSSELMEVSLQVPTPSLTLSPPPTVVSRHSSDASTSPPLERISKKRKNSDDSTSGPSKPVKRVTSNSLGRRESRNVSAKKEVEYEADPKEMRRELDELDVPKRVLRSRK